MTYPLYEYTANGSAVMNFSLGNGFPPEMYLPLVNEIDLNYQKVCLLPRSWWPDTNPADMESWHVMVDDYIAGIREHQLAPVVGIGHSMGGVINLMAAVEQPELFRAVVLIDPVFFPRWMSRLLGILKKIGVEPRMPLVQGALNRREKWASEEEAYVYFRGKSLFRLCSDEVVRLYTHHMLRPASDGVELAYPKEWEAQIFRTPPLDEWRYPPKIQVPCLIIAGENTNAFRPGAVQLWRRIRPDIPLLTVPKTSHLLPVEEPKIVAKAIQDFLAKEVVVHGNQNS